jgi:hypothetical protein
MMTVNDTEFLVEGRLIKSASIKDEVWLDLRITDPEIFLNQLRQTKTNADIFTFCQKLPDTAPQFHYYMEWDNFAVIPITSYDEWWTKRLPQVTRKNVRRGYKRGVIVKVAEFNNDLVKGIINIYNETPIRQGGPFWHYRKDFDTVKKGTSSYLSKSDFICAYYENELIGFIKLVYVGRIAQIMQIISMNKHEDKRPTNILIAKAMELCVEKQMHYFVYGRYAEVYGKKTESSLIIFKQRNGFEMVEVPRYYIPLSLLGKISLKLKIHNGIKPLIPKRLLYFLINLRAKWYAIKYSEPKNEE